MIQCDDCQDWFHGRCVNVQEFKGVECVQAAVDDMLFSCPICCFKAGEPYKYNTPVPAPAAEETASREKSKAARAARKQTLAMQRAWRKQNEEKLVAAKKKKAVGAVPTAPASMASGASLKRPLEATEQNKAAQVGFLTALSALLYNIYNTSSIFSLLRYCFRD